MHDTSDARPNSRIPAGVWVLGFVSLLMDTSSEMIHGLLPVFMATTLGASGVAIGLIEGLAESTALIVRVFSGALSDYVGKRKGLAVAGYGLAAATKPLFAIAPGLGLVLTARVLDRLGKGIRGAPRDALIADMTPRHLRGAAFGLRQSLDTVGALIGPLLAVGLMVLWSDDFRAVFWVASIPAVAAVALLWAGVREPTRSWPAKGTNPIRRESLRRLPRAYWWVVALGAMVALARFSEAFLVLRATDVGLRLALSPLVLAAMSAAYAISAYPFGRLSDTGNHRDLLALGLVPLIAADIVLGWSHTWPSALAGAALWGLHLGMTQGLLARMIADVSPVDLRGTSYGVFHLVSGLAALAASVMAGALWDFLGAAVPFRVGAVISGIALAGLLLTRGARPGEPD